MENPLTKVFGVAVLIGVVGSCTTIQYASGGTTTLVSERVDVGATGAGAVIGRYQGTYTVTRETGTPPGVQLNLKFAPDTNQRGALKNCTIDGQEVAKGAYGRYGYDILIWPEEIQEKGTRHTFDCEFRAVYDVNPSYKPESLRVRATNEPDYEVELGVTKVSVGGKSVLVNEGEWRVIPIGGGSADRWVGRVEYADEVIYRNTHEPQKILKYTCVNGPCGSVSYSITCTGDACGGLTTDDGDMDGSVKRMTVGGVVNVLGKGQGRPKGSMNGAIHAVLTVL